jgi:hypothetical protein
VITSRGRRRLARRRTLRTHIGATATDRPPLRGAPARDEEHRRGQGPPVLGGLHRQSVGALPAAPRSLLTASAFANCLTGALGARDALTAPIHATRARRRSSPAPAARSSFRARKRASPSSGARRPPRTRNSSVDRTVLDYCSSMQGGSELGEDVLLDDLRSATPARRVVGVCDSNSGDHDGESGTGRGRYAAHRACPAITGDYRRFSRPGPNRAIPGPNR